MFQQEVILAQMEALRRPNGAFVAAPTPDYWAMWLRDHLYSTFAYWYLNEYEKLKQGVWLVFDLFKNEEYRKEDNLKPYKRKLKTRIASPADIPGSIIHAKYHPDTLGEITADDTWGHHQLDALGLFLHIVADLDFKNIRLIRDEGDVEVLQLFVYYLRSVEYWHRPDFGMWEDCKIRHASSIGAIVGGLSHIRRQRLALVPDPLIQAGEDALRGILPNESRDSCCRPHHRHDCDATQLSLIWPYHVIVKPADQNEILSRLIEGHTAENGEHHRLLQMHGLNRYWGDDYYRSTKGKHRGISAEWPMFLFWISIVYSQRHEYELAEEWFRRGCEQISPQGIPEAYQNGRPNDHIPLAWAHAIALIAFSKLPQESRKRFVE